MKIVKEVIWQKSPFQPAFRHYRKNGITEFFKAQSTQRSKYANELLI